MVCFRFVEVDFSRADAHPRATSRVETAHAFRRPRWTFSTRVDVARDHSALRTRASPPFPTLTLSSTDSMCIADTRTVRVAAKQSAARHEHAPSPAFAVVAPAKRFDATEQDARCVRLAPPTRERGTDERETRELSRRDAQNISCPTDASGGAASVVLTTLRGARFRRARLPTVRVFPRQAQHRDREAPGKRLARGRYRVLNVRGDTTRPRRSGLVRAPSRPKTMPRLPEDDTRLTRAFPLPRGFLVLPAREKSSHFSYDADTPPTRFWRARASRLRERAPAAEARFRCSATPPACA